MTIVPAAAPQAAEARFLGRYPTLRTCRAILKVFSAALDEYGTCLTPHAGGALHSVGEAHPPALGGHGPFTSDNHNAVNDMREAARAKGAPMPG